VDAEKKNAEDLPPALVETQDAALKKAKHSCAHPWLKRASGFLALGVGPFLTIADPAGSGGEIGAKLWEGAWGGAIGGALIGIVIGIVRHSQTP
jgi:hypothetical protein